MEFINGAEAWTLFKSGENRIMAAEMWLWRRLLKFSGKVQCKHPCELDVKKELLGQIMTLKTSYSGHPGHIIREWTELSYTKAKKQTNKQTKNRTARIVMFIKCVSLLNTFETCSNRKIFKYPLKVGLIISLGCILRRLQICQFQAVFFLHSIDLHIPWMKKLPILPGNTDT